MDSGIDWNALFAPTRPIGEIVLRGTAVYLFLFSLMRILRREAGHIGMADLLVVVLIADAAQNAWPAAIGRSPRRHSGHDYRTV